MTDRIVVNEGVHFGKPCIAGTRIPVVDILELVRDGIAFDEIVTNYYPDIQLDDIKACLKYVIDIVIAEDVHISAQS
ncbi:MAG: DUF433 domain-containing protein [Chloroflexi bacterium]|nr:DUF433 domain-containing protein [Chloroflexota bacterium]MCH9010542.1 DUF433 domain-containing protein [Chloroflexota bacterium]